MSLRILVIHQYTVIRKIVQNYVLTERNDAIVDLASTSEEGLAMLNQQKYDVVLSGLEMSDVDGFVIRDYMLSTNLNKRTPFVIMTSSFDEAHLEKIHSKGIKYILGIPFTQLQLREIIGQIFDPRRERIFTRFVIPKTTATIKFKNEIKIIGEVVNISMNGILCEFVYPEICPNILEPVAININFPSEYGQIEASGISGCILRFTSQSWDSNNMPKNVRAVWKFLDIPITSENILDMALEKAYRDLLDAEEAAKKTTEDDDV